jgi:hypothetical protein
MPGSMFGAAVDVALVLFNEFDIEANPDEGPQAEPSRAWA